MHGRRPEPISVRNRTDLEPEVNRSRRGSEPISTRNSTDLGEGGGSGRNGGREVRGPGSSSPSSTPTGRCKLDP
ncbi:MAG: hypothetical protein DI576_02090 [Actinomyces sp.]|nr:MAG: hypothetical protein DI576_02090 [Actinomyces sp.]